MRDFLFAAVVVAALPALALAADPPAKPAQSAVDPAKEAAHRKEDVKRHRIMAAKARCINLGCACEDGTVAFVLEAPGGAAGAQFQPGAALFRCGIDKIGNRVEAIDRQTGVAVDHHPFGRGCAGRGRDETAERPCPQKSRQERPETTRLPFLPRWRHIPRLWCIDSKFPAAELWLAAS